MSKRLGEDENEGPNKRRKLDPPTEIVEDMEQLMDDINVALTDQKPKISNIIYRIPRKMLGDIISATNASSELETFKKYCNVLRVVVSAQREKAIVNDPEGLAYVELETAHRVLENLIKLTNQLKEALFIKSVPSKFAQASTWGVEQTRPQPILCLRPTGKQGLPLTLIHSIFSRFHQLRLQPLPRSPTAAHAMRVALSLCGSVGDAFASKGSRTLKFDKVVGNFLPGVKAASQIRGGKINGEPDHIIELDTMSLDRHCIMIREEKAEMGSGDAYMQVSRSFDLACEDMESNRIVPDAPVFLLCIVGPTLTIAGGFKDQDDTVVEPLCLGLFMLKDMDEVNGRAMQLAIHLFALRTCMEELRGLPNPSSPASGLPRVFQSFQDTQGETRKLVFQSRLSEASLLFAAVDDASRQLCVKIVYGPYGEQVHRVLSDHGMVPKLFGISCIKGGPTMIVMERLDDSWKTLHEFAQQSSRWAVNEVQPTILKRLESIVGKLEDHDLVHGDFRTNNIMVKENEEGSVMVIDFDWAGKAGEVHYPLDRNLGLWWPDEVGSAIRLPHDRDMLTRQWSSLSTS